MVNHNVEISFIELINSTFDEHKEEQIMKDTFPYYPLYKEGETLFIKSTNEINPSVPLITYTIVGVYHSLLIHKEDSRISPKTITTASMVVYLRKVD